MKGMWTKQLSSDGKIFFYNAHLNKSLWTPPSEAVIYEAPSLRTVNQAREELESIERSDVSLNPELSIGQANYDFLPKLFEPSQLIVDSSNTTGSDAPSAPLGLQALVSNETKDNDNFAPIDKRYGEALISRQIKPLVGSKNRFKAKSEDPTAAASTDPQSSYLQQKSAFEQLAGSKNDDSGKWLVR